MKKWWVVLVVAMVCLLFTASGALAATETLTANDLSSLKTAIQKGATATTDVVIEITASIDVNNQWEKMVYTVDHDITINGNHHTLTNMNKPLIAQTGSGHTLTINDLTISNSTIAADASDGGNWMGVGAFVGYAGTSERIELNNCHLLDSTVDADVSSSNGPWAGGLIGYAAGYSTQNNGPVFETVVISNCSVKNSRIIANGSAGAFMGHATGDVWTEVLITNATATNNTITCTEAGKTNKAGDLIGTSGAGGPEAHGKTGGLTINGMNVHDNQVTSGGETVDRAVGRFGTSGSVIKLSGNCVYDGQVPEEWALGGNGTLQSADAAFIPPVANAAAAVAYDAPRTGDETPILLLAALLMISGCMLMIYRKRFA